MPHFMKLRPSDIYFSQERISLTFGVKTEHAGVLVKTTLEAICDGSVRISDIPEITVENIDGRWVTKDNRRLWLFQNLEKLEKCDIITVKVGRIPPGRCNNKDGTSVRVGSKKRHEIWNKPKPWQSSIQRSDTDSETFISNETIQSMLSNLQNYVTISDNSQRYISGPNVPSEAN